MKAFLVLNGQNKMEQQRIRRTFAGPNIDW